MINTKNILTVDDTTTISDNDTLFVGQNSQLKQIDYDLLADAILNKISSKSYSELDTTAKTLIGAIDELNSKTFLRKDNVDLDSLDEQSKNVIIGAILTDDENKYPFTGGYLHIKYNEVIFSQFIFAIGGRVAYRRKVSGAWEPNWYVFTGTKNE